MTTNKAREVVLETRDVGTNFGCVAVIRDAKSRRKLMETRVYPYGFTDTAIHGAAEIATKRGWIVATTGGGE